MKYNHAMNPNAVKGSGPFLSRKLPQPVGTPVFGRAGPDRHRVIVPECLPSGGNRKMELTSTPCVIRKQSRDKRGTNDYSILSDLSVIEVVDLTGEDGASVQTPKEQTGFVIPTIEFMNNHIFVNGTVVSPTSLGLYVEDTGREMEVDRPHRVEPNHIEDITSDGVIVVKFPFATTDCLTCQETFVDAKTMASHVASKHEDKFIQYECSICGRKLPLLQGIAIHYGKCKKGRIGRSTQIASKVSTQASNGELVPTPVEPESLVTGSRFSSISDITEPMTPVVIPEPPGHICEECSAHFASRIGLGQHVRHAHPTLANLKRIAAAQADRQRKRLARKAPVAGSVGAPEISVNGHTPVTEGSTHVDLPQDPPVMEGSTLVDLPQDTPVMEGSTHVDLPQEVREALKSGKIGTGRTWSRAEDEQLITLYAKFHSMAKPNVSIGNLLKSKTVKQISDRRRVLGLHPKKGPGPDSARVVTSGAAITKVEDKFLSTEKFKKTIYSEARNPESEDLIQMTSRLISGALDGRSNEEDMETALQAISALCQKTESPKPRVTRAKTGKPKSARSKAKAAKFRDEQYLFDNDRKLLASKILDGKDAAPKCEIDPALVEEHYQAKFGGESQEVDLSGYPTPQPVDNESLLKPITAEEVVKAFRRANLDTASGPDGVELRKLFGMDKSGTVLANMYNTWLYTNSVPESVKQNKSILLPKGADNLDIVKNWRPLTISSVLLRLYTNIIAKRVLASFDLNPRQRGFIAAPGCAENSYLIAELIKHAKLNREPICITFLDLAAAFDTVSHKHLSEGLRRFGCGEEFVKIVENLYSNASTVFSMGSGETGRIPMTRGVKQGDPLSPLLFNIAMDPLLAVISKQNNGYQFGPRDSDRIESLAYADDNGLDTRTPEEMVHNYGLVHEFCQRTGMRLNVAKSAAFYVKPEGKDTYSINNLPKECPLEIDGVPVPLIAPDGFTKYLGSKISPWVTKIRANLVQTLKNMLLRIDKAALKPRQKLTMLQQYALPRLNYPLTQDRYPKGVLRDLEKILGKHVKQWFKLPLSTPNAVLYASRKDGGLGLPKFTLSVPCARINALRQVLNSSDPKIVRFAEVTNTKAVVQKLAAETGIKVPSRPLAKAKWRNLVQKEWRGLARSGKGRKSLECKQANTWLDPESKLFSEADVITSLQLRTDTYPTRQGLAIIGRGTDVTCRHCGFIVETLGHISGHCPAVKRYRIKRHNAIVHTLADRAKKKGWMVSEEPTLKAEDGSSWRPDLVFTKDGKAVVIDPTVVFEAKNSLQKANRGKETKYAHLAEKIKHTYKVQTVDIRGMAVGARGGWISQNSDTLKLLGIKDRGLEAHLCRLALKGTVNLVRLFMDL